MPVKKFKSFKQAEEDLWCMNPDESYYKRVKKIFAFAALHYKPKLKPGLYKYKTFEEAQTHLKEMKNEN